MAGWIGMGWLVGGGGVAGEGGVWDGWIDQYVVAGKGVGGW